MQCNDCGTDLEDALILVCDHNLCLPCAAKKAGSSGSIKCKTCAAVTQLESGSAEQLREMFPQFSSLPPLPILSIPQRLSAAMTASIRPPVTSLSSNTSPRTSDSLCGQCEQSRAEIRCLQCDEIFCPPCSESLHRRGKLAMHQLVPALTPGVTTSTTPLSLTHRSMSMLDRSLITVRTVSCATHIDEPVQYFCLRCETRPMCAECVFRTEDHRNHLQDVVLIRKAYPKIKSRVTDLVATFDKSIRDIRVHELNLVENRKSIETIGSNSRIQIEKFFSDLREVLKQREDQLIRQVDSVVERELVEISSEITSSSLRREKLESISHLLNSVVSTDHPTTTEREIEVLDSFAEMKSVIAESDSIKSTTQSPFTLKQLFVPSESVSRMSEQMNRIKSLVNGLPSIVPTRDEPGTSLSTCATTAATTPVMTSAFSSKKVGSSRRPPDAMLINAINDALRGVSNS